MYRRIWHTFHDLVQIVSLAVGDTLKLQTTRNDGNGLHYLTFCVSLIAFPYGH